MAKIDVDINIPSVIDMPFRVAPASFLTLYHENKIYLLRKQIKYLDTKFNHLNDVFGKENKELYRKKLLDEIEETKKKWMVLCEDKECYCEKIGPFIYKEEPHVFNKTFEVEYKEPNVFAKAFKEAHEKKRKTSSSSSSSNYSYTY